MKRVPPPSRLWTATVPAWRASADPDQRAVLQRWQGLVKPQRHSLPATGLEEDYLAERGLLDEVKAASAVRATRLDELMRLYGDAVDQVEGANPEDLLTLDALGLLLSPRSFNRIKDWRGLATRYDKLAITYRGGVVLCAITIWLRQ